MSKVRPSLVKFKFSNAFPNSNIHMINTLHSKKSSILFFHHKMPYTEDTLVYKYKTDFIELYDSNVPQMHLYF